MLFNGRQCAPIVVDEPYVPSDRNPYADRSYRQILRAVGDLRQDIAMVDGGIAYADVRDAMEDSPALRDQRLDAADSARVPALVVGDAPETPYAVIVGVIGESGLLRSIVDEGLFDEAKTIEDRWEAYALKEIDHPLPGVDRALVIAGSDARGAIYGVYDVSERIGVSPFYWYSDVPVVVRDVVDVKLASPVVNLGPGVRYRGIFINDEDISVLHWASRVFPTGQGTPDVNYYRHVFEMMLRLKLNVLWPAMHAASTSFNAAEDDGVPVNSREAALYGVIIGNSHCENMLRTNTGEWEPWFEAHRDEFHALPQQDSASASREEAISLESDLSYDFSVNREAVLHYWRDRLETNRGFENVITLGIRGIHDGAFHCANLASYPGTNDDERKVAFMTEVIRAQKALINEVYGEQVGRAIPKLIIVYKEIADVYNAGLDAVLATPEFDDVTLMWSGDNYGYVRQVPNAVERERRGGSALYFHLQYLGSPTQAIWLDSLPLPLLAEQLHRAWNAGMRSQWILNVGDIKPGELGTEYFARIAWDPEAPLEASDYLREQALRDYRVSREDADTVARAICECQTLMAIKRPEFFTTEYHNFDLNPETQGDEVSRWMLRAQTMANTLERVGKQLDADAWAAFYQQTLYTALSVWDVAEEYGWYWRNRLFVSQGRFTGALEAEHHSVEATRRIRDRVFEFNGLNHGKWTGYMDWRSIDLAPLHEEDRSHDLVQTNEYSQLRMAGSGLGVACVDDYGLNGEHHMLQDAMDPEREGSFDVFSYGSQAERWSASHPAWIALSEEGGEALEGTRVTVGVNWDSLGEPASLSEELNGVIEVGGRQADGTDGVVARIEVTVAPAEPGLHGTLPGVGAGYVESRGLLCVEAEHWTRSVAGADGSFFETIDGEGPHDAVVKAMPEIGRSADGEGARLEYDAYFRHAGEFQGVLYRLPMLNEGAESNGDERSCAVAIRCNGDEPQRVEGNRGWTQLRRGYGADLENPWMVNLLRGYETVPFSVNVTKGWNRIVIERIDPSVLLDRFVVETEPGALRSSVLGPQESPSVVAPQVESNLHGRTLYAFGDSIVAGHRYLERSCVDVVGETMGLHVVKVAHNGDLLMDDYGPEHQIISQLDRIPADAPAPDCIVFNGGTNDAYPAILDRLGHVDAHQQEGFDEATFAGQFERVVAGMRSRWPEVPIVYLAVAKLGARDMEVQFALRGITLQACRKWGVSVADVFADADLDTRRDDDRTRYSFDALGEDGLPGTPSTIHYDDPKTQPTGTHPNLPALYRFYAPVLEVAVRKALQHVKR